MSDDEQPPEVGDILDFKLDDAGDERRYIILYDEDYDDLLIDKDDSVALLVDNNQAVEILKLASQTVAALAPAHAPDEDPIDAMVAALEDEREGGDD